MIRIVNDNIAQDATLEDAATEALPVENMQTDIKSEIWRSAAKTATITATWSSSQFISLIAFPFCNFTSTATMQIKLYTLTADTTAVYDSGAVACCPYVPFEDFDWGAAPLGVNAFSYGGGAYARVWTDITACQKAEIIIIDNDNANSYLEAGILVAGLHWEPDYNFSYGAGMQVKDSSASKRNDAGDNISSRGTRHKSVTFNLKNLEPADRNKLMDLLKKNGKPKPCFMSLYPEDSDTTLEQDNQLYGKLTNTNPVNRPYLNSYTSSVTIEEI